MIALKSVAEDTVCIQTCKGGFSGRDCPVYKQRWRATALLFGIALFSLRRALDRFRRRAQHRSYTNKIGRRRPTRNFDPA